MNNGPLLILEVSVRRPGGRGRGNETLFAFCTFYRQVTPFILTYMQHILVVTSGIVVTVPED